MIKIDYSELLIAVKKAVREEIQRTLPTLILERLGTLKPVYTLDDACELLGVSKRQLQYLRDTNQISFIQNGRKILFRAEDLESFFQDHYVKREVEK